MRQRPLTCVFHRHEAPDKSEHLFECARLGDVLGVLGLREEEEAQGAAAAKTFVCPSAAALAPRESVSMTASHAQYTPLTRCHTVEEMTEEDAASFWRRAASFVAGQILEVTSGTLRRRTPVVGVFLMRAGAAEFTVGLITQGTARDPRLRTALSQFCGAHTLTKTYAELPLCAAHRAATLRLWWEPRTERVTPCRVMPPMKVILEEPHDPQPDGTQFGGYAAVNVFLSRPAASRLCGSTRRLLDGVGERIAPAATPNIVQKQNNKKSKGAAFSAHDAHGTVGSKAQGRQPRTFVFRFDDLSVVEEGEHLIGVEVETLPSYKPFVPTLYGHLAPFLVVGREDA